MRNSSLTEAQILSGDRTGLIIRATMTLLRSTRGPFRRPANR